MTGTLPEGVVRVGKKTTYTPEYKLKVVLESFQRDTTIEAVRKKFNLSSTAIHTWRDEFKANAHHVFTLALKKKRTELLPGQSPDELKRLIGELTVQNEILKKVQGLLG